MPKRSTSPFKNLSALRNAGVVYRPLEDDSPLGPAGNTLFQDLDGISMMMGVFPTLISAEIRQAAGSRRRIHDAHKNQDERSRQELLAELAQIQSIQKFSIRCDTEIEGKAECE
ncbi:hypothetical protein ACHAPU_011412 [Fusarium lateritium]